MANAVFVPINNVTTVAQNRIFASGDLSFANTANTGYTAKSGVAFSLAGVAPVGSKAPESVRIFNSNVAGVGNVAAVYRFASDGTSANGGVQLFQNGNLATEVSTNVPAWTLLDSYSYEAQWLR